MKAPFSFSVESSLVTEFKEQCEAAGRKPAEVTAELMSAFVQGNHPTVEEVAPVSTPASASVLKMLLAAATSKNLLSALAPKKSQEVSQRMYSEPTINLEVEFPKGFKQEWVSNFNGPAMVAKTDEALRYAIISSGSFSADMLAKAETEARTAYSALVKKELECEEKDEYIHALTEYVSYLNAMANTETTVTYSEPAVDSQQLIKALESMKQSTETFYKEAKAKIAMQVEEIGNLKIKALYTNQTISSLEAKVAQLTEALQEKTEQLEETEANFVAHIEEAEKTEQELYTKAFNTAKTLEEVETNFAAYIDEAEETQKQLQIELNKKAMNDTTSATVNLEALIELLDQRYVLKEDTTPVVTPTFHSLESLQEGSSEVVAEFEVEAAPEEDEEFEMPTYLSHSDIVVTKTDEELRAAADELRKRLTAYNPQPEVETEPVMPIGFFDDLADELDYLEENDDEDVDALPEVATGIEPSVWAAALALKPQVEWADTDRLFELMAGSIKEEQPELSNQVILHKVELDLLISGYDNYLVYQGKEKAAEYLVQIEANLKPSAVDEVVSEELQPEVLNKTEEAVTPAQPEVNSTESGTLEVEEAVSGTPLERINNFISEWVAAGNAKKPSMNEIVKSCACSKTTVNKLKQDWQTHYDNLLAAN